MKLNYKKKLCIFTTSRADYGLLRTFIKQIKNNKKFNSFVIATASHLEKRSGFTFKEIERDGIKIFKKINLNIENDTAKALSKSMATGIISFNKILEKINPDIIAFSLPFCLFPIFTTGFLKKGASKIPLEELPIITSHNFIADI